MRHLGALILALFASSCVASTFCFSVDSPEVHSVYINGLDDSVSRAQQNYFREVLHRRAHTAADFVASVARGSIFLGILFLVVRCAAHISALPRLPKLRARRLAGESQCGGEVRSLRFLYHLFTSVVAKLFPGAFSFPFLRNLFICML